MTSNSQRYDHQIIAQWVQAESKILDLGCGDGSLLKFLQCQNNISGYGLEINESLVASGIRNGVNVIQANLNDGLSNFDDDSFDVVILSLTLQAMRHPHQLLKEMLRIGKTGIVTFPNFAYWGNRLQLAFKGKMPVSKQLPYNWYDTPNIHLCTIGDFQKLCDDLNFKIDAFNVVGPNGSQHLGLKLLPNFFGEIALCQFTKR